MKKLIALITVAMLLCGCSLFGQAGEDGGLSGKLSGIDRAERDAPESTEAPTPEPTPEPTPPPTPESTVDPYAKDSIDPYGIISLLSDYPSIDELQERVGVYGQELSYNASESERIGKQGDDAPAIVYTGPFGNVLPGMER